MKLDPKTTVPLLQLAFAAAAAVGVYSFVTVAKDGEMRRQCTPTCLLRPTYAGAERRAPNFELEDLSGKKVSLASLRGKTVVLNFWTITCAPCKEEMPELAELARVLARRSDVVLVTVSTDEDREAVRQTLAALLKTPEPPFPVLFDPESTIVGGKYGTSLFPETWIIDPTGVVRARFDGARRWSDAVMVELVDQIRAGDYCPVQAREGRFVGDGARLCDGLTGS